MTDALQRLLDTLTVFLAENPAVGAWYTTVVRFVFPLLALMIPSARSACCGKSSIRTRSGAISAWPTACARPSPTGKHHRPRPRATCSSNTPRCPASTPRSSARTTARWTVYDLGPKGGVKVNDLPVGRIRGRRGWGHARSAASRPCWCRSRPRKSASKWPSAAWRAGWPACGARLCC